MKELFSSENAHFLNKNLCEPLEVIQSGNKLLTDLYIKPPDTHQHLEFSSCHVYRLKKPIPNGQPLRFNRICSENRFFDNSSNQLECWLKDRGYKKKVFRQQILKARKFSRKDLLNQDSKTKGRNKLVFNFTYHPAYSKPKHILLHINFLLTHDAQHGIVMFFLKCLLLVLRGRKVLKICWLGQTFKRKNNRCEILFLSGKTLRSLHFLEEKNTSTNKEGSDTHNIRKGLHLDWNSGNLIYLITCEKCKKKTICRYFYYRSCHRKFCWGHSFIQVSFHAYFMLHRHCSIDNWEIILIEKERNKQKTRKKITFLAI